jgi:transposase
VGVEGTGSYGAGLTRQLVGHGHRVREVSRPERKVRRDKGKSDLIDAELAARSVLAGTDLGAPKETCTTSESLRVLRATRRSAVKARTQAANLLHALLTAPGELRSRLEHGSLRVRAHRCARLRPTDPANPADATKMALRSVAQRWLQLTAEIRSLESAIEQLTQLAAPDLRAQFGVGADVAAALLIAVGGNPDRLVSEASFAALCGVSPIPASSGKTNRHRLNRGGDRQANAALHAVCLARLRRDPTTRAYLTRRTAEGLSKKDIMRCLKRYIARDLYRELIKTTTPHDRHTVALRNAEVHETTAAHRRARSATQPTACQAHSTPTQPDPMTNVAADGTLTPRGSSMISRTRRRAAAVNPTPNRTRPAKA